MTTQAQLFAEWNAAQDRARRSYAVEPFAASTCNRCAQGVHSRCTTYVLGGLCLCGDTGHPGRTTAPRVTPSTRWVAFGPATHGRRHLVVPGGWSRTACGRDTSFAYTVRPSAAYRPCGVCLAAQPIGDR